jgi:hypothetical protein
VPGVTFLFTDIRICRPFVIARSFLHRGWPVILALAARIIAWIAAAYWLRGRVNRNAVAALARFESTLIAFHFIIISQADFYQPGWSFRIFGVF